MIGFVVPVKSDIVLNMVNHLDNKAITFPSYDPRPWKLTIDCNNALCLAQPCHVLHLDLCKIYKKNKKRIYEWKMEVH